MTPSCDEGPLLSLIIPYCNAATTIARTLQSLLDSAAAVDPIIDLQPWLQIVAVDNASNDGSTDALRNAWASSSQRSSITLVMVQEPSRGVSNARNCGLSHASGAYVGFVDADDTVASGYFPQLLCGLHHQPDVVYLPLADEPPYQNLPQEQTIFTHPEFVIHGLKGWWCCSFTVRADLMRGLKFVGNCYEDYGLFPRLLSRARKIILLHRPIYHYERSRAGLTSQALHWRCAQWEKQFQLLQSHRNQLSDQVWLRVNNDYLYNRLVLRSLAGLLPVLSPWQSWAFIRRAGTPVQGLVRLGQLIYRNLVALRYAWERLFLSLPEQA